MHLYFHLFYNRLYTKKNDATNRIDLSFTVCFVLKIGQAGTLYIITLILSIGSWTTNFDGVKDSYSLTYRH